MCHLYICVRALGIISLVDAIDRLEQQQRAIVEPSEQAFVAKVRGVEHERAQAASHIQEQAEEVAARERDIERMQVCVYSNSVCSRLDRFNNSILVDTPCSPLMLQDITTPTPYSATCTQFYIGVSYFIQEGRRRRVLFQFTIAVVRR